MKIDPPKKTTIRKIDQIFENKEDKYSMDWGYSKSYTRQKQW